ncbi:MAG: hypothetical protein RJA07_2062 [Bacteroidota bacterium]
MTKSIYMFLILTFYMLSCGQNNSAQNADSTKSKKDTTIVNSASDGKFNRIARYWSGLHDAENIELEKFSEWKNYSKNLDSSFAKLDRRKFTVINNWSKTELKSVNEKINTVFYPFSGPDFYYANNFFPDAKRYIMVGLEPIGDAKKLEKLNDTSLNNYLKQIQNSLYAITNYGFFRTVAMKENFNKENLNGMLPLLYIFSTRRGYELQSLQRITLNDDGSEKPYQKGDSIEIKKKIKGVKITLVKNNKQQILYYFSFDLSNSNYKNHLEFEKFVLAQKDFTTYLKAASCLMHKPYFSNVRSLILNNATDVLQDDSGIPVKFFESSKWNVQLYGSYNGVISLFNGDEQPELKALYKDSSKVKNLPFGTGYKFNKGTSNLQLATKK